MFTAMPGLRALLNRPAPVRPAVDVAPEVSMVMEAVTRARIETLATVADRTLAPMLRDAIAAARDILIIGCSPFDVELRGARWSVRTVVVIEGDATRHRVVVDGEGTAITGCREEAVLECDR